mmetsp:Transcript_16438/g.27102  ORF Transcript_16438/g.27102 Transcript_16438/m.27102 type:complete len:702 (+) Transcript_16438:27-2132(+)
MEPLPEPQQGLPSAQCGATSALGDWLPTAAWYADRLLSLRPAASTEQVQKLLLDDGDWFEWLGGWLALPILAILAFVVYLSLFANKWRRVRQSPCCRCKKTTPPNLGGSVSAALTTVLAFVVSALAATQAIYLVAASKYLGEVLCSTDRILLGLVEGNEEASWSGFRNASVALIAVANLSITAAAEQASFMDPLAQLPTLLQSQLDASAELQAWLEENRIVEGHRCLFCESAKLDLGNYSALLQLGAAGQAAQQLLRGTLAQSEAQVLAENASAQGVALEEVSNALDNISSHLEASTHTWRATADWMPWAVGLLSSVVGVTALCSAIAACWVASQPSRLEVLGCVVNDAARDHAEISRVAWGGPETETGDLEEDFRVLRITSAAWYSAGLMTVAMLTGSAFTTIFALVLQDLSTVNPGAVLNTQVSTPEPAFAEAVLMTCFAGQGFAWPSFSTEAVRVAEDIPSPVPFSNASSLLASLQQRGSPSVDLAGRFFQHTDESGLLPAALTRSTASRKAENEDIPGMYGYAREINRLMLEDPPWSFTSLEQPSAACAVASQCRLVTTEAPSDALASRDLGGAVAVELFRVARQKERLWHRAVFDNQTFHQKLASELSAFDEVQTQLALLMDGSLQLLEALPRLWGETMQHAQVLQRSNCAWLVPETLRLNNSAASGAELLLMSALVACLAAFCLAMLTWRAFRLW